MPCHREHLNSLLLAGVGYATPLFQIGLYLLLFLLAPLYVEAVLLTLSNGGTYVMTRYALSRYGTLAVVASALVGIVISFSYVATAIVSLLAYSDYVRALSLEALGARAIGVQTLGAIGLSAVAAAAFGAWVMPRRWRSVLTTVGMTSLVAVLMSAVMTPGAVVMLAPLVMLFRLNNEGLQESVKVSKTIFLINLVVMGITIALGVVYLAIHGINLDGFREGANVAPPATDGHGHGHGHGHVSALPGLAMLSMPMLLAGAGSSILGASGVESVMNIPEELSRPREDVRRIYRWMLSLLLLIGGSTSLLLFTVLPPEELASKSTYLLAALGDHVVEGVTGSAALGSAWQTVIVVTAALMLIGATNTGFAGARGLWLTMARDNLLPTSILRPNLRGAYDKAHWLMLAAILGLAVEAEWSLPKLERWYGATFGLVMFSGMVAFVLLRRYRGGDARPYTAPLNVTLFGTRLPAGAIVGIVALGYALLSMYSTYRGDIGELRTLVLLVFAGVLLVLLLFNHRTLIRQVHRYLRRVVDTVESTEIETEDRTAVVAVGDGDHGAEPKCACDGGYVAPDPPPGRCWARHCLWDVCLSAFPRRARDLPPACAAARQATTTRTTRCSRKRMRNVRAGCATKRAGSKRRPSADSRTLASCARRSASSRRRSRSWRKTCKSLWRSWRRCKRSSSWRGGRTRRLRSVLPKRRRWTRRT